MKKVLCLTLAAVMVFALCACGSKAPQPSAGLPNPLHDTTKDGIVEATGISLDAPEGATDVQYFTIDGANGSSPIAQVIFTLDGKEFCYRAQATAVTSITANVGQEGASEDLAKALSDCTNVGAALAGYYYDWKSIALVDVSSREGVVAFNQGKEGFISWLDVVPGVLYSLSMRSGADQDLLMNTAELCFVPLQGDAG